MAIKAAATYFVPAARDGEPVDPESDLFPLEAEEDRQFFLPPTA